ncbi:MAG: hypothetical protein ACREX9_05025 [Gammaproteobacteria bacterium]
MDSLFASWLLAQEARALLTRLARVKPLALHEAMVPAAGISPLALRSIETYLARGRRELSARVHRYLDWLRSADVTPAEAQRRFTLLRLRFNAVLSQFDLFVDVVTQRSEHETGCGSPASTLSPPMRSRCLPIIKPRR